MNLVLSNADLVAMNTEHINVITDLTAATEDLTKTNEEYSVMVIAYKDFVDE